MISKDSLIEKPNWQQQANEYLYQGNYNQATTLYEEAIVCEPDVKIYYWYLGLLLLLQGEEAEAQLTWFTAMAEGEPEEIERCIQELSSILNTEAERRTALEDYQMAWVIRQHLREINPTNINNLLHIINLLIKLEDFSEEALNSLEVQNFLEQRNTTVDINLLLKVIQNLLNSPLVEEYILNFIEICLNYPQDNQVFIETVMIAAIDIAFSRMKPHVAARLTEMCVCLYPDNPELYRYLSFFYQESKQYFKGIETAKQCYQLAETLADKAFANHLLLRAIMTASGNWEEAYSTLKHQQSLLNALIAEYPTHLDSTTTTRLYSTTYFLPYFEDNPQPNRLIQNQIAQLGYENLEKSERELLETHRQKLENRTKNKIVSKKVWKIGYLSHCFKKHSVGWLSRWVFKYHNPERFQIHTYFINQSSEVSDFTRVNFFEPAYKSYTFHPDDDKILEQIQEDDIDILVDLDSITLNSQSKILSAKAAPIQVTWLGWDASGLPTIDYFIADPYVLPDSAQEYYREKLWRLPQTYIAVDGFEVDVPTLRRDELDIPADAVVYFMVQRGYKRNLPNLRLQMKILAQVPNSYLLIKGLADKDSSQQFYETVAEQEGVSCSQLRFLPLSPSEAVHRANLGIADVVLDTYPYNGATTTLETLWMCIPLVTRVGEQFVARNSYTMMMNAGITEGIAWTDEEYIEWGIRLGKDATLRQQIAWKLRQSRQTAPLWNAKQFTREMEKAYEQMWQRYVEGR